MKWKVTLSTGLFNQFDEIVEAASSADAKRTAMARNPTARVVSCWPAGGGSPDSGVLLLAALVAVGTIIAGSLGFIKVDEKPSTQDSQRIQTQEETNSAPTGQEYLPNLMQEDANSTPTAQEDQPNNSPEEANSTSLGQNYQPNQSQTEANSAPPEQESMPPSKLPLW